MKRIPAHSVARMRAIRRISDWAIDRPSRLTRQYQAHASKAYMTECPPISSKRLTEEAWECRYRRLPIGQTTPGTDNTLCTHCDQCEKLSARLSSGCLQVHRSKANRKSPHARHLHEQVLKAASTDTSQNKAGLRPSLKKMGTTGNTATTKTRAATAMRNTATRIA